jgi:hypothetical protein
MDAGSNHETQPERWLQGLAPRASRLQSRIRAEAPPLLLELRAARFGKIPPESRIHSRTRALGMSSWGAPGARRIASLCDAKRMVGGKAGAGEGHVGWRGGHQGCADMGAQDWASAGAGGPRRGAAGRPIARDDPRGIRVDPGLSFGSVNSLTPVKVLTPGVKHLTRKWSYHLHTPERLVVLPLYAAMHTWFQVVCIRSTVVKPLYARLCTGMHTYQPTTARQSTTARQPTTARRVRSAERIRPAYTYSA